jgi:hypothetical protein
MENESLLYPVPQRSLPERTQAISPTIAGERTTLEYSALYSRTNIEEER